MDHQTGSLEPNLRGMRSCGERLLLYCDLLGLGCSSFLNDGSVLLSQSSVVHRHRQSRCRSLTVNPVPSGVKIGLSIGRTSVRREVLGTDQPVSKKS